MKNKKIIMYSVLMILGVILFYIGGFEIKGAELKSLSGTFIGIGAGLFGMSISQIVSLIIIEKNPSLKKKMDIEETDERNIYIRNAAKGKAFDSMLIILSILMFLYLALNVELVTIFLLLGAYLLIYIIYIIYLTKYSTEM